jgi:hypothetical protein
MLPAPLVVVIANKHEMARLSRRFSPILHARRLLAARLARGLLASK